MGGVDSTHFGDGLASFGCRLSEEVTEHFVWILGYFFQGRDVLDWGGVRIFGDFFFLFYWVEIGVKDCFVMPNLF